MKITFERATPADAAAIVAVEIVSFHSDTPAYGVPLDGPPGYNSVDVMKAKIGFQKVGRHVLEDGFVLLAYEKQKA